MDLNKNYYKVLGIDKNSNKKEIKKSYYSLSFIHHPDKGGDQNLFTEITEAYNVLNEKKEEYDNKSRYGSNYDESLEILNYEFNNNAKTWDESKLDKWKEENQLNIIINIDDTFNGTIEYERWVGCKSCGSTGKDTRSKIEIKDKDGNVTKIFEGSDGCDFCEGSGKDWNDKPCYFCNGKGKVGLTECKTCKGEKRILGKQKISKINFPKNEKAHKVESMGHVSKHEIGKVGSLWLVKKG